MRVHGSAAAAVTKEQKVAIVRQLLAIAARAEERERKLKGETMTLHLSTTEVSVLRQSLASMGWGALPEKHPDRMAAERLIEKLGELADREEEERT